MTEQGYITRTIEIGGRTFSVDIGRVAGQASAGVLARYGETVVLVAATREALREGLDFFPLTVDYEERHYAVGRIPGSFMKREGRPGEKAILAARLSDRSIRPLFPRNFTQDVHVVALVMSVDQDCSPAITAILGASVALTLSDIPFAGPVGAVIMGMVDGQLVVNPTLEQDEKSDLHLTVAGTREAINMVEAGAKEVSEEVIVEALTRAHAEIQRIAEWVGEVRAEVEPLGLAHPKIEVPANEPGPELVEAVRSAGYEKMRAAVHHCKNERLDKKSADRHLEGTKAEIINAVLENFPEEEQRLKSLVDKLEKEAVRELVLKEKVRLDGRAFDEIRDISVEVDVLPRTHGSGLFQRGQTQVLSVLTLGAVRDEQILDGLDTQETKRFMHHYNFPSFSTGEARPIRSAGRREIGHGALAGRALEAVLPGEDVFPYTIRIVSEVLSSNGSTSMASVCGSCLALMDAGVPIKAPVAGIAMGLIKEGDEVAVLTDIQGTEDHLGDMDFKVAGTEQGVTALQMDIKIAGITPEILAQAMAQARKARLYILDRYKEVLPGPRPEISPRAPRIIHTTIDPEKIRDIIGPGGKIIRKITETTGVDIDVEDDGRVFITASDPEGGKKALEIIKTLTAEVKVGEVYLGRVVKIMDFGCFVEVIPGVLGLPGKDGLVHISQLAHNRVRKVEDVVREGDQILVKAIGFDNQGRLKLSKKEAMEPPAGGAGETGRPGLIQDDRPDRRPRSRFSRR
ncbi:MAG: polyribonucleotide nucleotidyltransferase [Bacillota bacterium]